MVVGPIIVDRRFGDVERDLDVAVEVLSGAYRWAVTTGVPSEFIAAFTVVPPGFTEVPPEPEFAELNVSSIFLVLRLSSSDSWDEGS